MFLKLGNSYTISLLVKDLAGNRITDDMPYLIIKDTTKSLYWNGISWSTSEAYIYMQHLENGLYQYIYTPDGIGVIEAVAKSEMYSVNKIETIEVFDEDLATYCWKTGTEFLIKFPLIEETDIPTVRIYRELDQCYWTGSEWSIIPTLLPMNILETEIAVYPILIDGDGKYFFTILINGIEQTLISLEAMPSADNIAPIQVSNNTLLSIDGTDSTILTDSGIPISGVSISVFDAATKVLVLKTMSDSTGSWSMLLKPGEYLFFFEKEGYVSINMGRTVK